MAPTIDHLVHGVRERTGAHLRSIALYGPDSYDVLFLRDDVDASYLSAEIDEIHDEMVLEDLGIGYLEDLFNAGDLVCSTHVFEEGVMMHLAGEEHHGLFVSFDPGPNVDILDVGEFAKEWLRDVHISGVLDA
jgi:hypothetical protein